MQIRIICKINLYAMCKKLNKYCLDFFAFFRLFWKFEFQRSICLRLFNSMKKSRALRAPKHPRAAKQLNKSYPSSSRPILNHGPKL